MRLDNNESDYGATIFVVERYYLEVLAETIEMNTSYTQTSRQLWRTLQNSLTIRIVSTAALIFVCYFTIGLQLAVVPSFVHARLGFSAVHAGLAVSVQYVATLLSRPLAGRMADSAGAKYTTCAGLLACATSGLVFLLSTSLNNYPIALLSVLVLSRLILGFGESWVATGATLWGIGRVGPMYSSQVISWSGIASYGALAIGAPAGVWLDNNVGIGAIGIVTAIVAFAGVLTASITKAIPVLAGEGLDFRCVLHKVFPYGLCLALGGIGFGTIASFITLYFVSRHWSDAGLALSLFGIAFVTARLLFANTIETWGGSRVAIISLFLECSGLGLLSLAPAAAVAQLGAAVTGFGFSLVFPALGVEVVKYIPAHDRGSALGVYTAFVDLSLGVSGPVAGVIVSALGYPEVFFFAATMAALSGSLLINMSLKPWGRTGLRHAFASAMVGAVFRTKRDGKCRLGCTAPPPCELKVRTPDQMVNTIFAAHLGQQKDRNERYELPLEVKARTIVSRLLSGRKAGLGRPQKYDYALTSIPIRSIAPLRRSAKFLQSCSDPLNYFCL